MKHGTRGVTRRAFFQTAAAAGITSPRVPLEAAIAQAPAEAGLPGLNRFPRMVQEHFVARVRAAERAGLELKAALKSQSDAERYLKEVRAKIRRCFGPMPERTPLNPQIRGTLERDAYRIEKVIFESRPGFLVTANLYLPKGRKYPLPGVVGTCGHTANGKAGETYQAFAQGLARIGYIVLIFDPIGQGERLQYPAGPGKSSIGAGVSEHLHLGNQQVLVGENLAFWRAWDGIRALDYLLTREEVDRRQIGITGNSGGGTMTTWLCALEPRWTMAAPGCFVTTFRRNLENELPADIEQYPPRALGLRLDMDDFLAPMAPKPLIILAKERDYFDARGAEEAFARLRRLYALLGAEKNVALHIGPTEHGYTRENREAMYRWFNRAVGGPPGVTEPELTIEKDETLWCAPEGSVSSLGSRTVFSFTREKSAALPTRRGAPDGPELARRLGEVLSMPRASGVPDYRILRRLARRGYPKPEFTAYAVETEAGVHALVYRLSDTQHLSRPPRIKGRSILYAAHISSDQELRSEPLVRELIASEPEADFFACDARGIGESRPDTCGANQFLEPYGSDYFYAGHALMLDRPLCGQRTFDLLRVIEWLGGFGGGQVHLAAMGWGAIPAAFAALRSTAVVQVTLKHALTSFSRLAESERYSWPLALMPPGVLERFDLPDCYRALEAKKLRLIEPWNNDRRLPFV